MEITNRIDQLLGQMRAAQELASRLPRPATAADAPQKADFSSMLKSSIEQVSRTQMQAESMTKAYETGAKDVQLHDVMISLSKANISFQQMVQVRNRLVSAYQDIMNMHV